MTMSAPKSKRPKDAIKAVRVPLVDLRRAEKAARVLKLTRNGFIVAAMRKLSDDTLAPAA